MCDFTSQNNWKCETILNDGVVCDFTSHTQLEVWDCTQGRVVCDFTSQKQLVVCDYIQWRVVCDFTSQNNWWCVTMLTEGWCVTLHHITIRSVRLYSMKGGLWLHITEQLVVCDYIQWRVVCDFTSRNNWWCVTMLTEGWCVTLHHITIRSVRLYSMKVGLWLHITEQLVVCRVTS